MFSVFKRNRLIRLLPEVRGKYTENAPLKNLTTFKAGGTAEVLFIPADAKDLADFILKKPKNVPITIIGGGSNLLIRDGGVPGVVIHLGKNLSKIEINDDEISCDAGAKDFAVVKTAQQEGLSGFEWLAGIPGSIGGAVRMNAGAHGVEIKDILVKASMIDSFGNIVELTPEDLNFSYRECIIPVDGIIISATFKCKPDSPDAIIKRMKKLLEKRTEIQPMGAKTAGSTFKNPEGIKAWRIIEKSGCKGLKIGGALISNKHCNFIINTGRASALDIENLGEEVRRKVFEKTEIKLQWEIRRIGVKTPKYSTFGGSR